MADELDPVEQQFIAEFTEYLDEMQDAIDRAREFADAALEDKGALDDLRDGAAEAGDAVEELRGATQDLTDADYDNAAAAHEVKDGLDDVRDAAAETAAAMHDQRDAAAEAAVALGVYRDAAGRLRDESGQFVAETDLESLGLGHLRDDAAEASVAVRELGDSADEAAAKLDLMNLSGLGLLGSLPGMVLLIGGLVAAIMAVAPAAIAAGLGLGAFAAFAAPTVMKVFGALKDTHAQLMKLPAAERDVVEGIKGLESEFLKLAGSIRPEVFGLLEQGLQIARTLLPEVIPLVQQGAIAFHNMLAGISAGLDSSGFIGFLHTMTALVVPATAAIGHLAGAVLGLLGHALTSLAPLSVPFIGALTTIISALSGPVVAALHVVISLFLGLFHAIEPLLAPLARLATAVINDLGSSFGAFIPVVAQVVQVIGGALLGILNQLLPVIENMLTPNDAFMKSLQGIANVIMAVVPPLAHFLELLLTPGVVQFAVYLFTAVVAFKALMGVINLVRDAWMLLSAAFTLTPLGAVIALIAVLAIGFYELWEHCAAFRKFWEDLWHDVLSAVDTALHWIESHWKLLPAFLLGPLGILVTEVLLHWNTIEHIFEDAWNHIKGIVMPAIDVIVTIIKANLTLLEGLFKATWDVIAAVFEAAWDLMKGTVEIILDVIVSVIKEAWTTIEGAVEIFADLLEGHWSAAWHELLSTGKALLGEIVNMIRSGVADFGTLLWDAGKALVEGLIGGIKSMFGALGSVASSIGHFIASLKGPIPADLVLLVPHGQAIMQGLMNGILSKKGDLAALLAEISGAIPAAAGGSMALAGGGYSAAGAAGGGGSMHITADVNVIGALAAGNPQLRQMLQQAIQEATLDYYTRNPGTGFTPYGRPGGR